MKKQHQVYNLIILDESGSMYIIKEQTIRGFNEIVQTVKEIEEKYPEQEHFISFLSFNGIGITEHLFNAPVNELGEINGANYMPAASTPLYDAIGTGVSRLEKILDGTSNYNVLVTIFTDGEENSSREYTGETIKKKIEELKLRRWTFTYTGTDHDVYKSANSLSINNVVSFTKNEKEMTNMFKAEKEARIQYSENIRKKKDTGENFYTEELEKK